MTRFAVFCPPFPSHAAALEALAAVLIDRGHEVFWIHRSDVRRHLSDPRIRFVAVGTARCPEGSLPAVLARAAKPGGPLGLRRVIRDVADSTDMLCSEAPAVLREHGVQVVIADQMEAAGGLLARTLRLPFVSVACALPVNREPALPLPVMPWPYATNEAGLHRNAVSARIHDWMMQPLAKVMGAHGALLGVPTMRTLDDCVSPLLQLSQTTASFDFPREHAPPAFHHVGPLRATSGRSEGLSLEPAPAPGKPFVFASLGTLQGGRLRLFIRIARACRAVGAQLLVAHCGGLGARAEKALLQAGADWVTDFVPQHAALARADVLVTHAGLNTVMDALAAGVPMLALPIAFDQPGVAARVVHAGVGLRLTHALASAKDIERALRALLENNDFRQRAAVQGLAVKDAPGAQGAADLIECALAPAHEEVEARDEPVAA